MMRRVRIPFGRPRFPSDDSDPELDATFVGYEWVPLHFEDAERESEALRWASFEGSSQWLALAHYGSRLGNCCGYTGHGCLCEVCSLKLDRLAAFDHLRKAASDWRWMKCSPRPRSCDGTCSTGWEGPCLWCSTRLAVEEARVNWDRLRVACHRAACKRRLRAAYRFQLDD